METLLASLHQTPLRDKKKTKRISENDDGSDMSTTRPQRKAAARAVLELKEKPLQTKMRQELPFVKVEKLSLENVVELINENDRNTINIKTEKVSDVGHARARKKPTSKESAEVIFFETK